MENESFDNYESLNKKLPISEKFQGLIMRRPRSEILRLLRSINASQVVDVCCGPGCLSCRMSRSGIEVTSVDSSRTMLARVWKKKRSKKVVLADAANLPFDSEFDAAIVSLALHEMDEEARNRVWSSMRHSVKPGGLLVALDFAVPKTRGAYSRFMNTLIEKDEQAIGNIHPPHYANYRAFMENGGMEGWLNRNNQHIVSANYFSGGTLGVFAIPA